MDKINNQNSKQSLRKKLFKGFSKLNISERFNRLISMKALKPEDVKYLKTGGVKKIDLAENCIENVIGYFQLPLGIAANFCIDGKYIPIPMAVEETSIIAAASKTARWVNEKGSITTSIKGAGVIGQVQIAKVKDFEKLKTIIKNNEQDWIQKIHQNVIPSMHKRGGGVKSFHLRLLDPVQDSVAADSSSASADSAKKSQMAVLHVQVNTKDAMGANIVNQVCEYLKTLIESASEEQVSVCIVSNLSDCRLAEAQIVMSGLETKLMQKIEQASIFAETDPYRAATNNKGAMNGIDAVLVATGNDWRAVSAGVHAYAARENRYKSITKWRQKKDKLFGWFSAPLMVGTVGGMTRLHPTAKMCLKMMEVKSAQALARICAAVALVQNLGALSALTTLGIIEGHMKLHIQNLTLDAGAKGWEIPIIQKHLEAILSFKKRISLSQAVEALKALRKKTSNPLETLQKIRIQHQQQALKALQELKAKHKKWINKL